MYSEVSRFSDDKLFYQSTKCMEYIKENLSEIDQNKWYIGLSANTQQRDLESPYKFIEGLQKGWAF